jgi:hypothetical protein
MWCTLDHACKDLYAVNDLILCGRHRDGEVQMAKSNGIQDDLALGVGID